MGDAKDEDIGILDGLSHIGDSHNIVRQLDPGKVLPVLVLRVDHLGQLLPLKLLLVDPHVDCGLHLIESLAVLAHNGGQCARKVARADDDNLLGSSVAA